MICHLRDARPIIVESMVQLSVCSRFARRVAAFAWPAFGVGVRNAARHVAWRDWKQEVRAFFDSTPFFVWCIVTSEQVLV